jgi:hypothetical protein
MGSTGSGACVATAWHFLLIEMGNTLKGLCIFIGPASAERFFNWRALRDF